ncbi:hypothetical protein QTP88_001044 [Uroleucon formosanum]
MLARLFSLKEEVTVFLTEKKMIDLLKCVCDHKFEMHLAYLVDIFEHLNKLNLQLQGSGNHKLEGAANIFIFEDKLRAFICKINLWISKVEMNNYSTFQTLKSIVDNEKYADFVPEVQQNVLNHLHKLKDEFNRYFPEYIMVMKRKVSEEDLIELQNDRKCKDTFESSMNIEEFWCKKAITYPKLREIALRYLVMFSTTYMCEQGFSALLYIKNKQRNRLDATKRKCNRLPCRAWQRIDIN